MAYIILNTGDVVLVDDEDYPLLSRYEWQRAGNAGYAVTTMQTITGKNHTIYLHKLVMGGFTVLDHINLDPLDCRKQNLRRATHQENGWNKGKPRSCRHGKSSSQYKGVQRATKVDGTPYWRVIIKTTKKGDTPAKYIRLGPFNSEIEAAKAYNGAIVGVRGKWAWINTIPDETEAA